MRRFSVDKRVSKRPARQNVADREYEPSAESGAVMSDEKLVRYQGVVKFFNPSKGYGFIRRDGSQDVFVHATELRQSGIMDLTPVTTGAAVEFSVVVGEDKAGSKRGPKAVNIVIIAPAPPQPPDNDTQPVTSSAA